jgi:hypothetical protein
VYLADRIVVMKPRPGWIADVLDVNLPRPRGPEVRREKPSANSRATCGRRCVTASARTRSPSDGSPDRHPTLAADTHCAYPAGHGL